MNPPDQPGAPEQLDEEGQPYQKVVRDYMMARIRNPALSLVDIWKHGIGFSSAKLMMSIFAPSPLFSTVALTLTSIYPFVSPPQTAITFPMAHMYGRLKGYVNNSRDPVNAMVIGCGEVLAEHLPPQMLVPQDVARDTLVTIIRRSLRHLDELRDLTLNTESYTAQFGTAEAPRARENFVGAVFFNVWPPTEEEIIALNVATAMKILYFYIRVARGDPVLLSVAMVTTMFLSLAKRGNATETLLEKVIDGFRAESGSTMTLDTLAMRHLYSNYCTGVDESTAAATFACWLTLLPRNAVRFKLILSQEAESGLTVLQTLASAIHHYPDFGWMRVDVLTLGEIRNFKAALTLVGTNRFYGYRKDLGIVNQNYINLRLIRPLNC